MILIFVYFPYIYALSTYYAIGGIYIPWYSSRIWEGGSISFQNPNPDYIVENAANQTLWVSCGPESDDTWHEVGYSKGWYNSNTKTWDPNVRTLYFAWMWPNGDYMEFKSNRAVGSPGSSHVYRINIENGAWRIFIDGIGQGGTGQILYSKSIDVGLESKTTYATLTRVYPTDGKYRENGVWKYWTNEHHREYMDSNYGYHFEWVTLDLKKCVDYRE